MTLLWTAADAAAATGGATTGGWQAAGVSIDSRTVAAGDLFIAIRGPTNDGHNYVADAFARGAVAAMVHQPVAGGPLLTVADTMTGLEALGRAARARSSARIAAVTGSVGKTSTKEALRLVLEAQAPSFASQGNLNNQWGAPLSLARMPPSAKYGVFELGMNHAGEIAALTAQVRPHVALITTIAAAHLGFFADVGEIADAKAEIFQGLEPGGIAILPRDNAMYNRLRALAPARAWSFGEAADADARLIDCSLHATCSAVTAAIGGEVVQYALGAPGKHWVINSLAVLLAVKALGADVALATRALAHVQPLKGRGQRSSIRLAGGSFTLIDESYNASPVSMAAAFEVLGRLDPGDGGRRIAVLGDMLELGDDGPALHAGLAEPLKAAEVDLLFTCGPLTAALPSAAWAATSAELAPQVAAAVRPGDVVMVKGSLGMRMATIVAAFTALDQPQAAELPRVVGGR